MFGGRDKKGPRNELYVLKMGKNHFEWVIPDIAGQPPSPRYGHSMNYYPEKSIMVIFGGRNDENFGQYGESFLNDVWILYIETLTWTRWNANCSIKPVPRYLHSSEIQGHSLMIFGGLSESNYCRTDVYSLDLDGPKRMPELINEKKELQKKEIIKDDENNSNNNCKFKTYISSSTLIQSLRNKIRETNKKTEE